MTIEEFIEARIAEREAAARTTIEIGHKYTPEGYSHEYEWARILIGPNGKRQGSYTFEPGAPSPEEVLRQCATLRRILKRTQSMALLDPEYWWPTQCDLASIWADHPDYRMDGYYADGSTSPDNR